ncbi:MAG: hypothetical protein ACM3SY_01035 [Candidatus Omnitrophota bacterium]
MKTEEFPAINYPVVSEFEFLKEVKNIDGKARKKKFTDERVFSPFYFFLKLSEIENNGTVAVAFYESIDREENGKTSKTYKKCAEKEFAYGADGKYYEYIMFFDEVETLKPGAYRYAIFCNRHLVYEGGLTVSAPEEKVKSR